MFLFLIVFKRAITIIFKFDAIPNNFKDINRNITPSVIDIGIKQVMN